LGRGRTFGEAARFIIAFIQPSVSQHRLHNLIVRSDIRALWRSQGTVEAWMWALSDRDSWVGAKVLKQKAEKNRKHPIATEQSTAASRDSPPPKHL
jgi:hypothetical protein